jgi:hypothetical protein
MEIQVLVWMMVLISWWMVLCDEPNYLGGGFIITLLFSAGYHRITYRIAIVIPILGE